jgi:hypothetical protein
MKSPLLVAIALMTFYAVITVLFIDKKSEALGRATVPVKVKR